MTSSIHAPGLINLWRAATEILGPELSSFDLQQFGYDPALIARSDSSSEKEMGRSMPSPRPQMDGAACNPVFNHQFGIQTDTLFTRVISVAPQCREITEECWENYQLEFNQKPSKEAKRIAAQFDKCIYGTKADGNDAWTNKYEIKWVNAQIGYGLYARQRIEAGDVIGYYSGILTNAPVNTDYAFSLEGSSFEGLYIDATLAGNAMRYINHTPDLYANAKTVEYDTLGLPFIMFVATAPINPGDAILYDYGAAYWATKGTRPVILNN